MHDQLLGADVERPEVDGLHRPGAGEGRQEANATKTPACPIVTAPEELAPYMAPKPDAPRQTSQAQNATNEASSRTDLSTAEVIGYMAYDGHDFLRKNGECIVAASHAQMQRTAAQVWPGIPVVIRGNTFEEIYVLMEGMSEVFCFDQESQDRFIETAQNRGMAVGDLQNEDLHLLFP